MELEERFWSKVDWTLDEDRCWPWLVFMSSLSWRVPARLLQEEWEG